MATSTFVEMLFAPMTACTSNPASRLTSQALASRHVMPLQKQDDGLSLNGVSKKRPLAGLAIKRILAISKKRPLAGVRTVFDQATMAD